MNKAQIYISTAREQKSLDTSGVRHDGYHVAYKVSVRHVVGHSRPASVAFTFVFFRSLLLLLLLLFCNEKTL